MPYAGKPMPGIKEKLKTVIMSLYHCRINLCKIKQKFDSKKDKENLASGAEYSLKKSPEMERKRQREWK